MSEDNSKGLPSVFAWLIGLLVVGAAVVLFLVYSVDSYRHSPDRMGYLGPEACAECHPEQAESWAETRMAKTFDVLRPGQKAQEKSSRVGGRDRCEAGCQRYVRRGGGCGARVYQFTAQG